MTTNRNALVLGATGGIGGEVARQLRDAGWQVRALKRGTEASVEHKDGMTWVGGDALNRQDVLDAAEGCSVIVHAVNPPGYRRWSELVLPMLDNTIAAATVQGATIVLPGTIYKTLHAFASFHMAGHWDADGTQVATAIQRVVGRLTGSKPRVNAFPWWLLTLASPLVATFRELREMRYLWRISVRMDNARLTAMLGYEPHTPLDEAIEATLVGLGCLTRVGLPAPCPHSPRQEANDARR